jgi:hypothetical protein
MRLGKTDNFPRGKFNKDDEGEIKIAVGVKDKTVIIDFGTPVAWLGMDANQALALAESIRQKAELCKQQ